MRRDVLNKVDMQNRLAAGEFGNAIRCWETYDELWTSQYRGPVYVRSTARACSRKAFMVPFEFVKPEILRPGDRLYEAPTTRRAAQGEITRLEEGLYVYGSRSCLPLRTALEMDGHHYYRLVADQWLRRWLLPSSVDHLYELLDVFPGHIVEFTEFREPLGLFHQKLVIWEVRLY